MTTRENGLVTAADVLYRLADIEENGRRFYEGLAAGAQIKWVKKLAEMLVRAETRHHSRFLEYARRAEVEALAGATDDALLPPDVARLLKSHVFETKEMGQRAGRFLSEVDAVKLAIRAEEQLALLLTQLRMYVRPQERRYVDRVIREEWEHKARLEEIYHKHLAEG